MAVAVKNQAEVGKGVPTLGLAGASLISAAYVLAGLLLVYHGIPLLYDLAAQWWVSQVTDAVRLGGFLYGGLKLICTLAGAVALIWLWPRIFREQPGLRAGTAAALVLGLVGLAVVYGATWLACKFLFASFDPQALYWSGLATAVLSGILWIGLVGSLFAKADFQQRLLQVEEQGWFSFAPYMKGQGRRVRRGTMLGILAIVAAGLWEHVWSRSLTINTQWRVPLPFAPDHPGLVVLYAPGLTLSIVIAVVAIWFSYRLVNYPRFADFLIATDAELNKVSWSTGRKLLQDTVVVLVTVALMAVFLWIMDFVWTFLLIQLGVLR